MDQAVSDGWLTKKIDQYIIVNKKLGKGSYGTVYRGYLEYDEKQLLAAKQIPMIEIYQSSSRIQYIKREIENLQKIDSKYVVKLLGVSRTQSNLYMFLEYCVDGDLKQYLKKREGQLSEPEAIKIFKHIVEGFKELTKHKIIHRDIKPANILMSNGIVKLADFGFSKVIEDEDQPRNRSFVGSPLYMAPEILDSKPFSSKCDVWSTGIVLYEMLYGKAPWSGSSQINLLANIKKQPITFPEEPIRSEKLKVIIRKMLQFYEKDRISWQEIFNDDLIIGVRRSMEESLRKRDLVESFLEKSILQNEAYIQKNLVVDYLAHIEEVEDDEYDRERKKNNANQNTKNEMKQNNQNYQESQDETSEENHTDVMDENMSGDNYQVKQLQFKTKANSSISNQNIKGNGSSSNAISPNLNIEEKRESLQNLPNQKSETQKSFDFFDESCEEKYHFEKKAEQLIKDQLEAEKMRKNILRVNEYILYERNVSFFYNFVIQKLIVAYNQKTLKVSQDLYYRTIFIISKCQTINLNKVNTMLSSPTSDFSQTIWDQYQSSLDYLKTQKLLVQDCWFAKKFNSELFEKTSQIVEEALKKESNPQQIATLQSYKNALNKTMTDDAIFKQVYQKTLSDLVITAKQQAFETDKKDTLIIFKYLFVCQNPYSIFNNYEFDFSRFYEQLENIKFQQLRQEILKNPLFKQ